MERAETAANALSADAGKVDFYLGDANDTGMKMGTGTVEFVDGAYTASVDVTIGQDKGFNSAGTFKFTADFGGYAPEGDEGGDSLAPNTGSAQLNVVESYTIDYEEETITIAEGFSLYEAESGGNAIFTSTADSDTTSLTNYIQSTDRKLYLQAPATGEGEQPDRREITIPARPQAPTASSILIDYSEERLAFPPDVTAAALEYALSQSDPNWQKVPSGAALSDMGWNGDAEKTYYFRKGATDTSFASSETTAPVTAPPRPEAPEGLLLQDWTDVSLSFYVGKGVQCRLGNEGAWVTLGQNETDRTFIDLTPQTTYTIYARYPATESQFASAEASAEGTTKSSAADAPEVGAATVTDTTVTLPYDAAWEYKMGDGDWRSILNPNVFTSLTAATQYTYYVRVKETETAEASEIATVTVWTAHAKPTGVQGDPNKITGVTTDMEYRLSTAEAWTECGGTEVTGLAAGEYQVRHKEDVGGAPASEAVTVTVDKGEQDKPEGEISLISSTENSLSVNFFSYMSENNAGVEIAYAKGLTANTPTSEWITVNKIDGSIEYSATIDQLSPGTPYVLFVRNKENDYFKPSQPITSGALYTKPKITTLSLPNAYVGVAYSAQLEAVAAEGTTVSWSLMEGSSLPAGLTLSTDGIISGTPTAATPQEATFRVTATIGEGTNSVFSGTAFVITISRSEAELGNLTVSGNTGIAEGAFQYGDTITVTFTPERSGDIATNALAENTAILTYTNAEGEAVMLATAAAQVDGSFTLSYDTKEKRLPTGEDLPLTVSYGGSGELEPAEKELTVTLEPATLKNRPTLSGNFVYGETVTANYTKQDDEEVTYQWYRGDQPIDEATSDTYKLTAKDVGQSIMVAVTATDAYHTDSVTSTPVTVGRAPGSITITCSDVTYGEAVAPSVTSTTNEGADVTYSYEGAGDTSYGPNAEAPKDAGTYTVTATVEETATHTSATSKAVSFSINRAELAAPQSLKLTSEAPGTATASWDAVQNASDYTVQLYRNGEAHGEPVVVTESGCEFSITEPGTYAVKVRANGSGNYADGAEAEASLTFFSVGFVTDGGGTVEPQVVAEGGKVTAPAELIKTGYTFGGWYSDEALTQAWDFDGSTVDGTTTLYAKWTKTPYAVFVETVGDGTASASVTTATMGDEVTLTAEPADGYHFAGWEVVSGDVAIADGAFTMPASDVTVKAVFERHASAGAWQSDAGGHWKVCDACGERFLEAAHAPAEDDGDCTTAVTCTVCGFTVTPALGAHDYAWTSNLDGTHSGACGHDGCDQQLLDQPCSYDEDGTCAVCGYERISVTTQPQDATVKEGETATFSVAAAGSNVASYQWQVSMDGGSTWADVAGATDDSYTTPAAAMDMDGWRYRCVVSNDGDRVESGVAALTVRKAASEVEPKWVGYYVEHYTQNADGGYDLAEREFLVGEIGKTVTARPKEYPGYAHNAGAEGTVATGTLESVTSTSDLVVLRAYYDLVAFSVTVETDGQGTASSSLASATMGQKVTLTAEPADGYHFAGWEVVSGEVALDGDSFAMPAGDVTVRAVFEPHAYGVCEPNQDGTHARVCAVCGERQTETCSGGTATCATLATCALCGQPYGELAEHEPEVVGAKDATCTEDGYTGDTVCSVCGHVIAKGEAVPATGHHFEDGVCTVCGAKDPEHEAPTDDPSPEPAPEDTEPTVPQTGDAGAFFSLPLALLGSLVAGAGLALRRRRS